MPRPLKVVSPDTLGGRIRAARQAQGLSLAQVAGDVYSTSLISQIERNKIEPSADSLKYLAERLHLSMDELTHLAQQSRESEAETHQYQKIEEKRLLATQLLETNHPMRALEQLENLPLARAPVTLRWRIIALRGQCYFNMREFLLAQQEFRAAFSILPDYIPPEQYMEALLLRLHMETACRRGGALALTPDDLDPEQCLIRLREKGETVRWQPVSPTLMRHLLAHGENRGGLGSGQRLLRYANGRPITMKRYEHLWRRLGEHLAWVETLQVSMYWIRHTILTWVERNFGFAVAEAYAGHEDNGRGARSMGAMATYVRAGLPEVATALAALTGEPHPLAIKDPGTGPAGEYRH